MTKINLKKTLPFITKYKRKPRILEYLNMIINIFHTLDLGKIQLFKVLKKNRITFSMIRAKHGK